MLLSARPLQFLGDTSYSLYLVHWPIVVLGKRLFPDVDHLAFGAAGIALSVTLAWFCYVLIEQPVRLNRRVFTMRVVLTGSAAGLAGIAVMAAVIVQKRAFPDRFDARINNVANYVSRGFTEMYRSGRCFLDSDNNVADFDRHLCIPAERPLAIIWGDSSAAHFYSGLREPMLKHGYALGQITASACRPLVGVDYPNWPNCKPFNIMAVNEILRAKPDMVILGALWQGDTEQLGQLDKTLDVLQSANILVVILGRGPVYKRPVPVIVAERMRNGDGNVWSGRDLLEFEFLQKVDDATQMHVQNRKGVRFVSVLGTVCQPECPIARNDIPFHNDAHHMTPEGSAYFGNALIEKILRAASF